MDHRSPCCRGHRSSTADRDRTRRRRRGLRQAAGPPTCVLPSAASRPVSLLARKWSGSTASARRRYSSAAVASPHVHQPLPCACIGRVRTRPASRQRRVESTPKPARRRPFFPAASPAITSAAAHSGHCCKTSSCPALRVTEITAHPRLRRLPQQARLRVRQQCGTDDKSRCPQ